MGCWEKCSNYEETAHKSRRREAQEEGEEGTTQKKRKSTGGRRRRDYTEKEKSTGGRRKEGSHEKRRRSDEGKRGDPLPTRGKQKALRTILHNIGTFCEYFLIVFSSLKFRAP